ncbi:hypothetical protein HYR99_21590 [Candidatus Poribacteria bacterium]|nr:hypothetical protein [Candidatus Poribacteria bacterium]
MGSIWAGTPGALSRYDGKHWTTYTQTEELKNTFVLSILQDKGGTIGFGTWGGGVGRFDGRCFQTLDSRDGLVNDNVRCVYMDRSGGIWIGTANGVVRFTPNKVPPTLYITEIRADEKTTYARPDVSPSIKGTGKEQESFNLPTGVKRVVFGFHAISFKTRPGGMKYFYQLVRLPKSSRLRKSSDQEVDWQGPTNEEMVEYFNLKPGKYTFRVQAVDRDLNYSEIASVEIAIPRPMWVYALIAAGVAVIPLVFIAYRLGMRLQTQRAIAQQFNPYIAGRVVGSDLFYGRSDLIVDIERTLANNCFLLYGERRIGKSSIQHQLRERLGKAEDPTYRFIPAYIDLQGVTEDDFFRTIAAGVVETCRPLSPSPLVSPSPSPLVGEGRGEGEGTPLTPGPSPTGGEGKAASPPSTGGTERGVALRLDETRDGYSFRDLNRDLRAIIDHLKEGETKTIKLVLLMDEVDTLNSFSLTPNLNLRRLFMGPLKENLVLVMSGLYLKMDWSAEGGGSPPFNFLSREIQIEPLKEEDARRLITEPVKGFYTYEPKAMDLILAYSELRPFTIQAICLRAVNRVLADGRQKITAADIEAIKDSVLAEVASIRGERAGTALPVSLNEALVHLHEAKSRIAALEAENARLQEKVA